MLTLGGLPPNKFCLNFLGPARNARTQVLNSFGLGYRLVGTDAFKDRVLTGADTLFGFRWQV